MLLYYSSSKATYILVKKKKVLAPFFGPEGKWHGMTQIYTAKLYTSLLF